MTLKPTTLAVLIAVALAAGGVVGAIAFRAKPDPAYYVDRAKYEADLKSAQTAADQLRAIDKEKDQLISAQNALIATARNDIVTLNTTIGQFQSQNAALAGQTAALIKEVQPVLDANPKVAALVAGLQKQVANDGRIAFDLRLQLSDKDKIVAAGDVKFASMVAERDSWKSMAANYEKLLAADDALCSVLEHEKNPSKFWRYATPVAAALGAVIGYELHK